ncbi:MAG: SLBB domain-containing protein [Candidatus Obscuribacterales bacterium]|nr:SLBB domain-containing protein [Candidatus Obscuribacterales bacterium]
MFGRYLIESLKRAVSISLALVLVYSYLFPLHVRAVSADVLGESDSTTDSVTAANPFQGPEIEVGSYILGPGDQLQVIDPSQSIDGEPITTFVNVLPDGTVSIYPIGILPAAGKTISELEQEVNNKAAAIIKSPQISLSLEKARPATIYVLGYVLNPGRFTNGHNIKAKTGTAQPGGRFGPYNKPNEFRSSAPALGPLNKTLSGSVSQGTRPVGADVLTVLTAIQLAGGVRESADIRHVALRRRGTQGVARTIDLWNLLIEGVDGQDVLLQDGDVVFVPKGNYAFDAELLGSAADQSRPVRIIGDVQMPGIYRLSPRDDLLSIIARAGGFNNTAKMHHVVLSRMNREGKIEARSVSIGKSMKNGQYIGRVPVRPGDLVQVKTSYVKRAAPRVATGLGIFTSAFLILYLSRLIVDQSNSNNNN